MSWIKKNIPNLFTLGNLCLGVLAIQQILTKPENSEPVVHLYVFLAAFFDLLDGAVARALKVSSKLGVQLDSLADLITFGVLPTLIYSSMYPIQGWGYLILLVPACSAIRLAVFNIIVAMFSLVNWELKGGQVPLDKKENIRYVGIK